MKYILIIVFGLIPSFIFAKFNVLKHTNSSVILEFELEELSKSDMEINQKKYSIFSFRDGSLVGDIGQPAIPAIQTRLAIPFGAKVISGIEILQTKIYEDLDILPIHYSEMKKDYNSLIIDRSIYDEAIPYPEEIVEVGEAYSFMNVDVVPLSIHPIQYFPSEHRVQVYTKIRITFQFKDGMQFQSKKKYSSYEENLLTQKIINYKQSRVFSSAITPQIKKFAPNYDLSTGLWYKIPVTEEGIYQITGSFLQSHGIDINSVLVDGIHMYNYGGYALPYDVSHSRPEDLNEIAIEVIDIDGDNIVDANDRIIFYGKGMGGWQYNSTSSKWEYEGNPDGSHTLFPYDDVNYYLLTFNSLPGKRILTENSPSQTNPRIPTKFTGYYHFEEDHYNILSSGLDWYWLRMIGLSDNKSTNFQLPQNLLNDSMQIKIRFKGGSGSIHGNTEKFQYTLKTIINNQTILDNLTFARNSSSTRTLNYTTLEAIHPGNNILQVQHIGNLNGCEVFLDCFEIRLKRPFIAENSQLIFHYTLGNDIPIEYRITGMPLGTNAVWDLTDYANIRKITPLQNGSTIIFQDSSLNIKAGHYYVFSPNVIRNVSGIEQINNHPNLRDPSRVAQFIIITPDEFYDEAEFLEIIRETQIPNRIETERVMLSQIYNEFSCGVKDITAIRDFIKYAYDNWQDTLKYVLLFGDGHFDYRQKTLTGYSNYIPPFEITGIDNISSRESDNFFTALGMGNYLGNIDPNLSVGRLPFYSLNQIQDYKDKVDKYSNPFLIDNEKNGWQTWLTFVSDDQYGNTGNNSELSWHLEPTENIINNQIPHKFNLTKIYLHDYDRIAGGLGRWKPKATEDLLNQINRGTLLINFFGHGDPDTWAHESVLNRTRDLPYIQNDDRLPIWVAATCDWGKYDNPARPSMSEELIWLPRKGGIVVISASRGVYVTGNTALADTFYNYLFNRGSDNLPGIIVGEAFLAALGSSENFQKFHLFGDPTMQLADPEYQIKIDSIGPADTLRALTTVTVTASIYDKQGNPIPDFNGYAVLNVADAVDSLYVIDNDSRRYDYVYNGGTIFKGIISVSNGEMLGRFIVPKSIKYDPSSTGRLSLYAWSENSGDAIGYSDTLLFTETESQIIDQDGPEITIAFKDMPNFFDGDFVSSQPTLQLELYDDNGINLTGEVGHKIELSIDEGIKKDVTEFFVYNTDSYQQGKLEYTLPALKSGNHQLKISCWDNLNNYSERFVSFRTTTSSGLMITEVVNYPNPFENETYFTFQMISPLGFADVTISIYTLTGRKIQEIHGTADSGFNKVYWDGLDWDGDIPANGVYLYKIVLDDGHNKVEKIEKLAVVR